MRVIACLVLCLVGSGCISLPRDQQPPFPQSIDAARFDSQMAEQLERAVRAQHVVSIADATVGEQGLYLYLLVTARPPSEHLSSFASNLGRSFSNEKHPERRLEAIGPDGRPVVLLPMIYPMDFHIGFRTISFAHPGNWPVRPDAPSSGVIQLCMWRTRTHLSPGRYRMRLLPPRDDSDWVWDATGGVHGDFEWRELDLVRVRSLD